MKDFLSWVVWTPYPYAAVALPVIVLIRDPSVDTVASALVVGVVLFGLAGWVNYRYWVQDRGEFSAARSRARIGGRRPSEEEVRRDQFAAGVIRGDSRRRAHYLILAPSVDEMWRCVREPSRRGRIQATSYSGFDAMIRDLNARGVFVLPLSGYSRGLASQLRRQLEARGVQTATLAAGEHRVEHRNTLVIGESLTGSGPRYAEFDRRVPTRAEAEQIIADGLGLALIRVPKQHQGLEFLEWFPSLRGLFVSGRVDPGRIGELVELRRLSLISTGNLGVDLSRLRNLVLYEGELKGRESVLELPVRELYLERVSEGILSPLPPTVEEVSLSGAEKLETLDLLVPAGGLRELTIDGSRVLDLGSITALKELRSVSLMDIGKITGVGALEQLRKLRELTLIGVEAVDDISVLDRLTDKQVMVNADELDIRTT